MTIRRRLFFSNILMIVLPPFISMLAIGLISSALMGIFGITMDNYPHSSDPDFFYDTQLASEKWTSGTTADEIEVSLAGVMEDFPKASTALYVYRDSQLVWSYRAEAVAFIPEDFLVHGDSFTYIKDGTRILVENTGIYTVVGVQENYSEKYMPLSALRWRIYVVAGFILIGVVCIIMLVNGLLTRMITKHIMMPLSILTSGVRQIADGNLAYRIAYTPKDEFAPVIADFNDMASHLQAMVAAQQKDDESRRELIAGISHDLRTPLTSIIGYVEGLEQGIAATPAMQARYLSIIHEQADVLSHTINQLFLFTKLDTNRFPMHMETLDLADELRAYTEAVSETYTAKGLTIRASLPAPGTVWVRADRIQLRNVLTNVLENSVKYGPKHGGEAQLVCTADEKNATIALTDNGPGAPEETLPKLFSVFYRSDASRQNTKDGSGLGLAISARIMQRFGGTISASNAEPHGLSIRLMLPITPKEGTHAKDTDY